MTSWVLNEESSRTAIGDVLALAAGSGVEIRDDAGRVVAKIIVSPEPQDSSEDRLVAQAESDPDELRRRRGADRSRDVTTAELLTKAASRERK
jgi:hypothetical protein